jgi:hypothetical protein
MAKPNGIDHELQSAERVLCGRQLAVAIESKQSEVAAALTREVQFTILPDGRMVDLIRSAHHPSNIEFLVWQRGHIGLTTHIEHDGELLVVPKMDPTLVSALQLPTTARPCPEIPKLFSLLMKHIDTFVDITPEDNFLVAAFVVNTWFAERLPVVPYLSICGPLGSGKTTLLDLLQCFCRRSIHASAITPAAVYRLADQLRPTFLIDEADFGKDRTSRDLQRLLRGGNRQGSRVICNGRAFENFGPKVIASRVPLDDGALISRNINIVMTPSDRDVPSLGPDAKQELSDALQPMLLMFRLKHYAKVGVSQPPGFLKFPPRLRDNARALASTMFGNEELQERLAQSLESQMRSLQFDRFSEPEWVVMLALYGLYHEGNRDRFVQELTAETNRILRENGETRGYSPKRVGQILNKSLGFTTRRMGEGYRIDISVAIGRKIHRVARGMGLKRADMLHWANVESGLAGEPCPLCSEYGMMTDHEGRTLLTLDEALEASMPPCTNCGLQTLNTICPKCRTPK